MQLIGRLEIKSREKIIEFLSQEHVGRLATIDSNGYPQAVPMNFVFFDDAVYMHSHIRGEKLENIRANPKSGFEVDRELEFLPSYFFHPTDASRADTLYISVVIKGASTLVRDPREKASALNALMKKYQPEGRYEPLRPEMEVLDHVAVIRILPEDMRGKYKIGQTMRQNDRVDLAQNILKRGTPTARETLRVMGFEAGPDGLRMTDEPVW